MAQAPEVVQQALAIGVAAMYVPIFHPQRIDGPRQAGACCQVSLGQRISLLFEGNGDVQAGSTLLEEIVAGRGEGVQRRQDALIAQGNAGLGGESLVYEGRAAVLDRIADHAKAQGRCRRHGRLVVRVWFSKCHVRVMASKSVRAAMDGGRGANGAASWTMRVAARFRTAWLDGWLISTLSKEPSRCM